MKTGTIVVMSSVSGGTPLPQNIVEFVDHAHICSGFTSMIIYTINQKKVNTSSICSDVSDNSGLPVST